jgi:hypothetical protein
MRSASLHDEPQPSFLACPSDLTTFSAVPVLLAAGALGASYTSALRATRIDPLVALRDE